jgi:hypothetical protein
LVFCADRTDLPELSHTWRHRSHGTRTALRSAAITVATVTLVADRGSSQEWSVVVAGAERPCDSASAVLAYYRMPVLYSHYGHRAATLPARINGPGPTPVSGRRCTVWD